jgi:hypothetical protein
MCRDAIAPTPERWVCSAQRGRGTRRDQEEPVITTKVRRSAAKAKPPRASDERIATLKAKLAREEDTARTQAALYRIAELASAAPEMQVFYRGIHEILGGLIYA